jgi:hypothetical protein
LAFSSTSAATKTTSMSEKAIPTFACSLKAGNKQHFFPVLFVILVFQLKLAL